MTTALGDVKIAGKAYRVNVGSYRSFDSSDFSPRASVPGGSLVHSELALYQPFHMTSWNHGFGRTWFDTASGYMITEGNMDTRHSGIAMMYSGAVSSDTNNNRKRGFVNWRSGLYSWGVGGIRRFIGGTWSNVYTMATVNYVLPTGTFIFAFPDGRRPIFSRNGDADEASNAFAVTSLTGANNDLTFTANATGIDGNNIRVTYLDDPANPNPPTVSVVGNAISVNIDSGVTLASAVRTAIQNNSAANALITVGFRSGNTGAGTVTPTQVWLTGGNTNGRAAEYVSQSTVAHANLRFEAVDPGTAGNAITVQYVTGASAAGQEVVSVAGNAITVTMHANSTAQMIMNAILADNPIPAQIVAQMAGSNNEVLFTAVTRGEAGNNITIRYRLGATAPGSETVTVSGNEITVTFHRNSRGAHVVERVNATAAAVALVTATNVEFGTGVMIPSSETVTSAWSKTWRLRGGSTVEATKLISVRLAAGENGSGLPGVMAAMALQGGSGKRSWYDTGIDSTAVDFRWGIVHNGRVYASEDADRYVHYASEDDLRDLEAGGRIDPNVVVVGAESDPPLSAIVYAGHLYIAKPDGLYNLGEDNTARRVLDYSAERSLLNFTSMAIHNGFLVFPLQDRICQWNGARISDITPPKLSDNFPYRTYGNFNNFVVSGQFLYVTARTNETNYAEDLLCFDGVAWFRLCGLTVGPTAGVSAMGYDSVNNRLWYHIDQASDVTMFIQFQDRSAYPHASFPTTGEHSLITSRLDMGFRRITKSTPSIIIEASNILAGNYFIKVFYSLNGAAWTPWGGTDGLTNVVSNNGITELINPLGTPLSTIEYFHMEVKLQFVTTNPAQTPVLESLIVRFLMRPKVFYGFSFNIIFSNELEYGQHVDGRMPKEMLNDLYTARDSKAPVTFEDIWGVSRQVYVTAINEQVMERHIDEGGATPTLEGIVSVNLVEAA